MPYGATRPIVFPSTMANIVRPQHVNVSRSLLQITWRTKSLVAMPTLLNKRVTSPKRPYDIKKTHKCYFGMCVSNPCKVTPVFRVPMYLVCSLSDYFPPTAFAFSFDTSRMFHVAFDLFASILCCCVVDFQRFLYGLPADTN